MAIVWFTECGLLSLNVAHMRFDQSIGTYGPKSRIKSRMWENRLSGSEGAGD